MAYQISSSIVIDDSGNVTSTSNITATSFSGKGTIPEGTTATFEQANAPTGFTKVTAYNDYTLRVVSGTGGGTGGTVDFTTAFSNQPISVSSGLASHTLTTPQIPSHGHSGTTVVPGGPLFNSTVAVFNQQVASTPTGSSNSHTHPQTGGSTSVDLSVKYVDVILATRDT